METAASATDRQPLAGRTVVVCRAEDDAGPLIEQLEALGASTIALPLHRLDAPADGGTALAAAIAELSVYRWVVATSANGARAFATHLAGDAGVTPAVNPTGRPVRELPAGTSVAAVGPATAAAFSAAGIDVDLVAPRATAADLAVALPPVSGSCRVLAPLNEAAADTLVNDLQAKGYTVDRVDAYRMIPTEPVPPAGADEADVVLFASPSQVDAFVDLLGVDAVPPVVACIGPRTAGAASAAGLAPIVQPATHTIPGLIDALVASLEAAADPPIRENPSLTHEKRNP